LIQPTVFAVIVATVLAHGFSLAPLSRRLGVSVAADAERLAIVGASPWSGEFALTLHRAGVPVGADRHLSGCFAGRRVRERADPAGRAALAPC
jgi:hypothetical protein